MLMQLLSIVEVCFKIFNQNYLILNVEFSYVILKTIDC